MRVLLAGPGIYHRGSYMSASVVLNLLNELRKKDKMRGLPSILSLFRINFNKFNNTAAWVSDSIYHMALKSLKCRIFEAKTSRFCHLLRRVKMDVIRLRY